MARQCQITGKKTTAGNNRPFSMKATKRVFRPNLFVKRMFNPETGKVEKMKLSAKAIKTLKKWANQGAAKIEAEETVKKTKVAGETGKHVKKEKLTPKQKKEQAAAAEAKATEAAKAKVDKDMEKADEA